MFARLVVALFASGLLVSCGGSKPAVVAPPAPAGLDLDSDPLALLPGAPVVVASVDAKALYSNPALGPQIEALEDRYVPLGRDAGFDAKRDVDRVTLATYDAKGGDVSGILSGRFDVAKMTAATKSRTGAPIVKGHYDGRDTFESGRGCWVILTPKTIVTGTSLGVRQVLDRIQAAGATLPRAEPAWMLPTLETAGAAFAACGDYEKAPLKALSVGPVQLSWMEGIQRSQTVGHLQPPGLSVRATLSYGDAGKAGSAADSLRGETRWLGVLGPLMGGISLRTFDARAAGNDVTCDVSVDDDSLGKIAGMVAKQLPGVQ